MTYVSMTLVLAGYNEYQFSLLVVYNNNRLNTICPQVSYPKKKSIAMHIGLLVLYYTETQ